MNGVSAHALLLRVTKRVLGVRLKFFVSVKLCLHSLV